MTRWTLPAAVLLALLSACAPVLAPSPPGAPHDPEALMRPDLIVAEPSMVVPGQLLALTFPAETERGIHFVVESWMGSAWVHRFDLTSDGPGPGWAPRWTPAAAGGFAVEDIGVGGAGPDHVLIPVIAEPGTWQICTGNAAENVCTQIEIVHS